MALLLSLRRIAYSTGTDKVVLGWIALSITLTTTVAMPLLKRMSD
jgi:hypothetical protein